MLNDMIYRIGKNLLDQPNKKAEPCPHCGAGAIVIKYKKHKAFPYRVKCLNSFCSCQTERFNEVEAAIDA